MNDPCLWWGEGMHHGVRMEVRGQLSRIGFLLHHVGPGNQTQVSKLDSKYL